MLAPAAPFTPSPRTAFELPCMARIVEIIRETPTVKTFVLDTDVDARPGQFVMLWLPGVDEKPMSIAGTRPLTISVAKVGPMTTALHGLGVGSRVGWRGPFGRPFQLETGRHALLVAGGYGSAPLYALAEDALAAGLEVTVAIGARVADELLYADKFERLGVRLLLSTNDGSRGIQGFVTDTIRQHFVSQLSACHRPPVTLYACGPEPMLVALHKLCREHGWNGQLSVERYMKCGFGICGQCALDDLLVCVDGPVMTLDQLEGKQDFGRWHRGPTGRKFEI
ncbi:MAG: dihydroorotate dehydrogenase electron transfer subunit [Anaerolineae bacterium]|nr:dihydroorotate dehydrogenase electron transfer subunit [Anaerolineae bacterium]